MATLMFLDQFNNYFNRIIKKYNTVSDYGTNSAHSKMSNNYNFKPNDNVEFRIELMNDKDTSDLYRNPSFEIVFPKYVKEVNSNGNCSSARKQLLPERRLRMDKDRNRQSSAPADAYSR